MDRSVPVETILVIDDGVILESGTHAELMAKKGAFFDLAESQEQLSAIVAVEG